MSPSGADLLRRVKSQIEEVDPAEVKVCLVAQEEDDVVRQRHTRYGDGGSWQSSILKNGPKRCLVNRKGMGIITPVAAAGSGGHPLDVARLRGMISAYVHYPHEIP